MGAAFGGGGSQTLFGSTGASSFLSRLTTIAAIVFMLTSLSLAYVSSHRSSRSVMTDLAPPATEQTEQAAPEAPIQAEQSASEVPVEAEQSGAEAPVAAEPLPAEAPTTPVAKETDVADTTTQGVGEGKPAQESADKF
jgi:preprotein translocase subunit SecG